MAGKANHRVPARFALTMFLVSASGCFSAGPVSTSGGGEPGSPLGSFAFFSGALGHIAIKPSACEAGGRQFFLGGDFAEESTGMVVRLVVDPIDGPAARVFSSSAPFEKAAVFRKQECRLFHFSLDSTGWRVNRVDDYQITLDVDCTNSNGDTLIGKASATHCH